MEHDRVYSAAVILQGIYLCRVFVEQLQFCRSVTLGDYCASLATATSGLDIIYTHNKVILVGELFPP